MLILHDDEDKQSTIQLLFEGNMKNRTRRASKHCCNLFFRQVATLGVDAIHDLKKRNEANFQKNNNFSGDKR